MTHTVSGRFELEAFKGLRDRVIQEMGVLCPNTVVRVNVDEQAGPLGAVATLTGDTAPYPFDHVKDYLLDLGVRDVVVEPVDF